MKKFTDHGVSYLRDLEDSEIQELAFADINRIITLLKSRNAETRYLAVLIAGLYYCPDFDKSLVSLLKDWRLLIRVNACDSLSNSSNVEVCNHLLPLMYHCHRLERGYAMLSYSDIIVNSKGPRDQALDLLHLRFFKEKDPWARVFGIEAIAQLGDKDILEELYGFIAHDLPHVRRIAIKCAGRFTTDLNQTKLLTVLQGQQAKEDDPSIISELNSLLAGILGESNISK